MGHVEPGGEPLTGALSATVELTKVSVGPMDNNAYLLVPRDGGAVLIDAADEQDRLQAVIAGRSVAAIVTTHQHGDHLHALPALAAATGAQLYCGSPDAGAIADATGLHGFDDVWDGNHIALGTESLQVIGLVGHTPGSITLAYHAPDGTAHLFTGDSLFPGGPGRTRSPGDFLSLMDDLERKIFAAFDDSTQVHPGHGDDTTLGAERPHLSEWRHRGW